MLKYFLMFCFFMATVLLSCRPALDFSVGQRLKRLRRQCQVANTAEEEQETSRYSLSHMDLAVLLKGKSSVFAQFFYFSWIKVSFNSESFLSFIVRQPNTIGEKVLAGYICFHAATLSGQGKSQRSSRAHVLLGHSHILYGGLIPTRLSRTAHPSVGFYKWTVHVTVFSLRRSHATFCTATNSSFIIIWWKSPLDNNK